MKKLTLSNQKLRLKKEIVLLSNQDQTNVQGGFTYSLSLGYRCRSSKQWGADNLYDCAWEKARSMMDEEVAPQEEATPE